jgi:uncharacterized membrane protein (UPF0127 family)
VSAAAGLALALAGAACRGEAPPPAAGRTAAVGERARVVLHSPSGRRSAVVAEVARSEDARARGLMFRERLGDDEGMLFVFDEEAEHAFWMKNTLIPLDLIFADGRGTIVGIVASAEPGSLELRSAGRSRLVLEVRGGWAAERGVRAGDRLVVEELPR